MATLDKQEALTYEVVSQRVSYDPLTGRLRWLKGQRQDMPILSQITNKAGNTYIYFTFGVGGRNYNLRGHRVAWLLQTGRWPVEVDHKDGDGLNNSWENLREVSRQDNSRNNRKFSHNSSGLSGVSFKDKLHKWRAYITVEGKQRHLGNFDCLLDAAAARKSSEVELRFSERHGK